MWLSDFVNLFFPNVCNACGNVLSKDEQVICLLCNYKLPKTNFHKYEENPVSRIFWGRVNIHAATSFLFFNKGGNVQKLIHQLKYKGNKAVGEHLGELFGNSLMNSELFGDIDAIVPVPLHKKKLKTRGFNQSDIIATGIGRSMKIPVLFNVLTRTKHTGTQTNKARYNRWKNVDGKFMLINTEKLNGKHLLLIDDVLTTGATLEACAQTLMLIKRVKISMATVAYAQG